ncbi:hypothetical protein [Ferrovibrio sp.]|uniref:hypothetical protein n=1 Tax=Ferrovibrio sp. TaxID=1917215 RepID=UPI003D0E4D11
MAKYPDAPEDFFCELFRELNAACSAPLDPATELADTVDNPDQARTAFRRTKASAFMGEVALLEFMERAHAVMADLGGDPLANRYFILTEAFLTKYSLRYDLRRPFSLNPTLPGVFSRLMRDLKDATAQDADLHPLMMEFEDTIRDLRADRSAGKIKSCIQKQVNLLEAIGQRCPGVTTNTLGQICDQVGTWPHNKVKDAMKELYRFASDYPGIRHGGTPANSLRNIEMRDLVAVSILLAGFSPYLTNLINPDNIYRGS